MYDAKFSFHDRKGIIVRGLQDKITTFFFFVFWRWPYLIKKKENQRDLGRFDNSVLTTEEIRNFKEVLLFL